MQCIQRKNIFTSINITLHNQNQNICSFHVYIYLWNILAVIITYIILWKHACKMVDKCYTFDRYYYFNIDISWSISQINTPYIGLHLLKHHLKRALGCCPSRHMDFLPNFVPETQNKLFFWFLYEGNHSLRDESEMFANIMLCWTCALPDAIFFLYRQGCHWLSERNFLCFLKITLITILYKKELHPLPFSVFWFTSFCSKAY